ncbi:MAG TPA: prolyl oligopeptidase family serine peptidase [Longimicrobiales bacterium]|nr:prolyl oligopeptidase family serine peptidase [Longimicrobiales bacterium]
MKRALLRRSRRHLLPAFLIPCLMPAPAAAQQSSEASVSAAAPTAIVPARRSLPIADFARWRAIASTTLSRDGAWVAWTYTQVRQDDELHVRHIDSGREHVVERASRPVFSDDGRWVAYSVSPTISEIDKLQKDKKPVPRRAELMNLETGAKTGWDDVASFDFADGSSHLAVQKSRPDPEPEHEGADLILRDLRTGVDELIGSVSWHAFNKPGTLLAWTTDADEMDGNGLYVVDLRTRVRKPLDSDRAKYARAAWSESGNALAVLRGVDVDTLTHRANTLIAFTNMGGESPTRVEVAPHADDVPAGHVVSDKAALQWSEAGDRLFFGVKAQEPKEKDDEDEDEAWQKPSDVTVFHWNDDRLQTVQEKQAESDRNRAERAVLHTGSRRVVMLQDSTLRGITIGRDGRWAVAWDDRAYMSDWEESRADYYRIDVNTGERTPMLEAQMRTFGMSPDGSRYAYWKDDHVWSYELASGRHVNLTARAPVSFVNAEWDYLSTPPAYGVAGWAKDGRGIVLMHRYDLWLVPLDGGEARNLTNGVGSEREIRFRYVQLDPEERFIDLSQPLLLSAYGQWTKEAGFYQLSGGRLRELVYTDNIYGGVQKARDADRLVFTRQSWTEFPDLQVARTDFAQPQKITDANPHQAEYSWGRRILFDYTNRDGVRLQGTLAIPEDYQPGQRLPMLVNFYEKYSQNLHLYPTPRFSSGPQFAGYVSEGYLVMQPDVHFRGGSSHSDMLECVEAAIAKVVELGYADPARVGLHGHSYSGGGASYIATRSKAFAAIVAGAAPINLVNEFNILFRGSGQNNHSYDIYGQGRYGSNPYDDFDMYWDQSPISGVRTMDTPLLYMHGDNDQIVEYNQGMEFYNALRFNRKPVIFLSYPGEGHSLSKLENNLDYQTRMSHFFGHYLKGEPAAPWMTDGERFIDKQRREPIRINVPARPAAANN